MMVTLQCRYPNPYPFHFISSYFRICQPLSLSLFLMFIQHKAWSRQFKNCIWDTCTHSTLLQSWPTLWPYGLSPTRLLCPWDFPGKLAGVGCHVLLKGIFWNQGPAMFPAPAGGFFTTSTTWEAHIGDTSFLFKDHKHESHLGACWRRSLSLTQNSWLRICILIQVLHMHIDTGEDLEEIAQ